MTKGRRNFDAQAFLDSTGLSGNSVRYSANDVVFSQGDRSDSVMYIQEGEVKISVRSNSGKDAVVAMLTSGEFFGEGCLAGQPARIGTATAITPSSVLVIKKRLMMKVLHEQRDLSRGTLAEMIGTTRSRVTACMNKFKKMGLIEYNGDFDGGVHINSSLLSVVLHE